ncbi:alpha/beta-Hydrolases protein [Dioscorea alata]|uniref:Alpha/beta-Hydrolases protein n=2 Tax=Dioscorea alata TaxID=55571 RepID=A0ACB7WSV2_DIOAL|nr:alpha/beta-Hydrolases protein [Dioscorea alata]
MAARLLRHLNSSTSLLMKEKSCGISVFGVLGRCLSQFSEDEKTENAKLSSGNDNSSTVGKHYDSELCKDSSDDEDFSRKKWKLELAWLSKALEPALQVYKWALTKGSAEQEMIPPSSRSLADILSNLQLSKAGILDWSLSDLTIGLYLIYLSQASAVKVDDFEGVQILTDHVVQDLIYHVELAKGSYKDNATGLARRSMLLERNILKFVKNSSVLRPGYYIGIDTRNKLVILGIRGTDTVYDLITDAVTLSDQEVSFEGFSTHFGTTEAARWFLRHELGTIRKCLEKHKNFKLRLVGHSLGGAAAALLAIMLRKQSAEELGFDPEIVSAVGFGTPPCVSEDLAGSCSSYVSTVILQDDIIPRLSTASLAKLRNEILETDWMSVLEKDDWKRIVDLVTNAKQVVSSVQEVARKLADYATNISNASEDSRRNKSVHPSKPIAGSNNIAKQDGAMPVELFTPGMIYYLKREIEDGGVNQKSKELYTLWKGRPAKYFQRIRLSGNLISDHKCDNHYYALRDVLKCLPGDETA